MSEVVDMAGNPFETEKDRKANASSERLGATPTFTECRRLKDLEDSARLGNQGPLLERESKLCAARELLRLYEKVWAKTHASREDILSQITAFQFQKTKRKNKNDDPVEFKLERWILPKKFKTQSSKEICSDKSFVRLQKSVFGYLFAIERLSEMLDDEDATINKLKILRSTIFWSNKSQQHSESDEIEPARELSFLFSELARSLANKNKLGEMLKRVSRVPGRWNRKTNTYDHSTTSHSLTTSPIGEWIDDREEWPLFPSTRLITIPYTIIRGDLNVETFATSKRRGSNIWSQLPRNDAGQTVSETNIDILNNTCLILSRDIHLVVAPMNDSEFEMLMESREHWELSIEESESSYEQIEIVVEHDPTNVANFVAEIKRRDGWHRVSMPTDQPHWWDRCIARFPDTPDEFNSDPVEHPNEFNGGSWWPTYLQCNPGNIDYWLGKEDWSFDGCGAHFPWHPAPGSKTTTNYVRGYGRGIEAALYDGAIEQALKISFDRIIQSLDTREKEWRKEIKAQGDAFSAKLRVSKNFKKDEPPK